MTDHPRFQRPPSVPDTAHRSYHGGSTVDLVFELADRWRERRAMARTGRERTDRAKLAFVTTALAALMLLSDAGSSQEMVRVRGTIEQVEGGSYVVKTRDGSLLTLSLAANANVASSVRSSISDIRPGAYIGVAAVPQPDGTLRAIEAHIFDESMRGTAEGHRAWDLLPKSTMTNAVVQEIVGAVDGQVITLRYKDGQQSITLPSATTIVTYLPGSVSELTAGAVVFVPGAARQPDGSLLAQRVMVGRNAPPPQ